MTEGRKGGRGGREGLVCRVLTGMVRVVGEISHNLLSLQLLLLCNLAQATMVVNDQPLEEREVGGGGGIEKWRGKGGKEGGREGGKEGGDEM